MNRMRWTALVTDAAARMSETRDGGVERYSIRPGRAEVGRDVIGRRQTWWAAPRGRRVDLHEYDSHPSIRKWVYDGDRVITF